MSNNSKKVIKILFISFFIFFGLLLVFSIYTETAFAEAAPGVGESMFSEPEDSEWLKSVRHWVWDKVTFGLSSILRSVALLPIKIPLAFMALGSMIIMVFSWLLLVLLRLVLQNFFLNPAYYQEELGGFYSNEIVATGWNVVVQFANILFIITLLFIGIGTLFRIEKYNYKKLLIKLIIIALLTNFSLTFSGLILDFFNIIMFKLAENINLGVVDSFVWEITQNFLNPFLLFKMLSTSNIGRAIGMNAAIVMGMLFVVMTLIVYIGLVLFLLTRLIALWILLIFSPFGYAGLAHPDTQGIAQKWWSNFLKFCIQGPIIVFMLWFSLQMLVHMYPENNDEVTINGIMQQLENEDEDKQMSDDLEITWDHFKDPGTWVQLLVITGLMVGSLVAANATGAFGAGMLMTGAKILGGGAVAASFFIGKGLFKKGVNKTLTEPSKEGVRGSFKQWGKNMGAQYQYAKNTVTEHIKDRKNRDTIGEKIISKQGRKRLGKSLETMAELTNFVGLGRAAFEKYKRGQGQKNQEAYERASLVSQVGGNFLSGKYGKKMREIEESEIKKNEQKPDSEKLSDEELKETIRQKQSNLYLDKLDEAYQEESVFFNNVFQEQENLKRIQGLNELKKKFQNSTNKHEKAALMIKAFNTDDQDDVLEAGGYDKGLYGLKTFLKKNFSKGEGFEIGQHLEGIAASRNNIYYKNIVTLDENGRRRYADSDDQMKEIKDTFDKWGDRGLATNVQKSHLDHVVSFKEIIDRFSSPSFERQFEHLSKRVVDQIIPSYRKHLAEITDKNERADISKKIDLIISKYNNYRLNTGRSQSKK